MNKRTYVIGIVVLMVTVLHVNAQVSNGLYRALTDANSARVVALGGLPLPVHDGDLQTTVRLRKWLY